MEEDGEEDGGDASGEPMEQWFLGLHARTLKMFLSVM
jgi:hypothetical protein